MIRILLPSSIVTCSGTFIAKGSAPEPLKNLAALKVGSVKFYFLTPRFEKPPGRYEDLIREAFGEEGVGAKLSVDELCVHILRKHKFFRDKIRSLKACIRSSIQGKDKLYTKHELVEQTDKGTTKKRSE